MTIEEIRECKRALGYSNKMLAEKTAKLCLFGAWHFAENQLGEFVGE